MHVSKEIQGLCGDGMEDPASVAVASTGCFTYGLQLQCGDVIAWTGDVSVLVGASSRWQCLITFFLSALKSQQARQALFVVEACSPRLSR